eukprot:365416-Chlamydomonas_euryale.AAC.10
MLFHKHNGRFVTQSALPVIVYRPGPTNILHQHASRVHVMVALADPSETTAELRTPKTPKLGSDGPINARRSAAPPEGSSSSASIQERQLPFPIQALAGAAPNILRGRDRLGIQTHRRSCVLKRRRRRGCGRL